VASYDRGVHFLISRNPIRSGLLAGVILSALLGGAFGCASRGAAPLELPAPDAPADEVATAVLRYMCAPYVADEAPTYVTAAILALYRNDRHFIAKVMSAAEDPNRNGNERGRLLASLGLLGRDAAAAVAPRMAEIATGRADDPAWRSGGRSGAAVALRGLGDAAARALADVARNATPERAREALSLLPTVGPAAAKQADVILGRLATAQNARELIELLDALREIDPDLLWRREARACGGRVLAIVGGGEAVDDDHVRDNAARLLPALAVDAARAVPALVRRFGSSDDASGWGGLGVAAILHEYGGAAGPPLVELSKDADPRVREAAFNFMVVPGVRPWGAAGAAKRALKDDTEPSVREAAAAALAEIGGWWAKTDLEEAARADRNESVRMAARNALGRTDR
jgi:HEAT repeat protein